MVCWRLSNLPSLRNGGDDDILSGAGSDIVFGGFGSDYINIDRATGEALGSDNSRDVIVGDNGQARFGDNNHPGILTSIFSTDPEHGASDHVFADGGDDVVIGGSESDYINVSDEDKAPLGEDSGDDVIIGDNGRADFEVLEGQSVVTSIQTGGLTEDGDEDSSSLEVGAADYIFAGAGKDIVLGGVGSDEISAGLGAGSLIALGDNGKAEFAAGILRAIQTLDYSVGAGDLIVTSSGNNVVFGGAGGDDVRTGSGNDVIIGDNGNAVFGSLGHLETLQSSEPSVGGGDKLLTGAGDDVVIGGALDDVIDAADGGDNRIIGDNGKILYQADTTYLMWMETIAPEVGSSDDIYAGDGQDIVIGGADADRIELGGGNNVGLGDHGILSWIDQDEYYLLDNEGSKLYWWAYTTGVSDTGIFFPDPRLGLAAPPNYQIVLQDEWKDGAPIHTGLRSIPDVDAYVRSLPDGSRRLWRYLLHNGPRTCMGLLGTWFSSVGRIC